jgi:light-regulated signal transduction histidine kinase (bacteriophytochrome)
LTGDDMGGQSKASNGRPASAELADDGASVQLNADALHDLVGPINQMRAMADLILKRNRGKLDGDTETMFGFLQASSDRLENLLSGLRTHMRIVGRCEPYRHFDANAIFAGALATIQQAIDGNEAVVTHDSLPEVYGDPNQICYIFASLIENSIKFRSQCRPEIHIAAAPQENGWRFSVRDNGIGIDPRHSERIFGVFKRIHNEAYPGTGMGLAIASRIVQRHGGRIWVESQLGHGATFFFTLPRAAGDDANPASVSGSGLTRIDP